MVEKDKQMLLQSYECLGLSGLCHSEDKLLVQSFAVGSSFTAKRDSTELHDALTSMWNRMARGGSPLLHNRKLLVHHVVEDGGSSMAVCTPSATKSPPKLLEGVPNSNTDEMALETDPESELRFTLSHNEATPRCMLTLRHPGTTNERLVFKVRLSLYTGMQYSATSSETRKRDLKLQRQR